MKKNLWQKFNPTLKEKMEDNPNITLLGLWWAWYWRLVVLIIVFFLVLSLLAFAFGLE